MTETESLFEEHPELRCNVSTLAGWNPLIADTLREIIALSQSTGVSISALEIKEKFGALRMYYRVPAEPNGVAARQILALLKRARERSETVCEVCSMPGTLQQRNGWWRTRCAEHIDA
jgi:hypothetical protein